MFVCFYKSINIKHSVAAPCDQYGVPLQKTNGVFPEPPPPKLKAVDDWSPFESEYHFRLAELLYCKARMSVGNTNELMTIVASPQDGEIFFKSHKDLCSTIDASELGDVPWETSTFRYQGEVPDDEVIEWMTTVYEIYYRNPRAVIKNMIANTTFKDAFDYVPYQEFDDDGYRRYQNFMSGDWAFHQAVWFFLYLHHFADPVASIEHHRERCEHAWCHVCTNYSRER